MPDLEEEDALVFLSRANMPHHLEEAPREFQYSKDLRIDHGPLVHSVVWLGFN